MSMIRALFDSLTTVNKIAIVVGIILFIVANCVLWNKHLSQNIKNAVAHLSFAIISFVFSLKEIFSQDVDFVYFVIKQAIFILFFVMSIFDLRKVKLEKEKTGDGSKPLKK